MCRRKRHTKKSNGRGILYPQLQRESTRGVGVDQSPLIDTLIVIIFCPHSHSAAVGVYQRSVD